MHHWLKWVNAGLNDVEQIILLLFEYCSLVES